MAGYQNLIVMYFIKRRMVWVPATYDEITIGIRGVSIDDLEKYYCGIHPFDSFHYKASRYLCAVGLEAVTQIGVYKRQAEVDKVFFDVVTRSCEKCLLDWVNDWREVYRQFAASRSPFRDLIVTEGNYELSGRQFRMLQVEISQIKGFFSILKMEGALRMIKQFYYFNLWTCREHQRALPEVYPFALKGKPVTMLAKPASSSVPAVAA